MALYFHARTNKKHISYKVGEPIEFTVLYYSNHILNDSPRFKYTVDQDDGKSFSGEGVTTAADPFVITTSLSRPGFVRLQIEALKPDGTVDTTVDHGDFGAGADVDKLTVSFDEPVDFDKYWEEVRTLVREFTPTLIQKVPYKKNVPDWCDCYDVKISTPLDTFASGYVTVPKAEGKYPVEVNFLGYAVTGATPLFDKKKICINLNAHGCENGFPAETVYAKYPELARYGFEEDKNTSPYTTYWRGVVIRDLIAVKWSKTLEKWNGKTLIARGGSQGALRATTVAAQDSDITFLNIWIPWFCDLHKKLSGYMFGWHPEPSVGTDYFDTCLQGKRVKCPVNLWGVYLGDYCCPPSTVLTLYNSITAPKKMTVYQGGTHGYRPIETDTVVLQDNGKIEKALYRHYKGGTYQVLDFGKDSETGEGTVIYKNTETGEIWVRPASMWNDTVFHNGEQTLRFVKL
jgi:cephalosporin-C deacetylase-like acetyl esterase